MELYGGGNWRDVELVSERPGGSRVEWLGANGRGGGGGLEGRRGRGGERLGGWIEGGGMRPFLPLKAMNGRGRGDDVSMTSSFYFFDLLLF